MTLDFVSLFAVVFNTGEADSVPAHIHQFAMSTIWLRGFPTLGSSHRLNPAPRVGKSSRGLPRREGGAIEAAIGVDGLWIEKLQDAGCVGVNSAGSPVSFVQIIGVDDFSRAVGWNG